MKRFGRVVLIVLALILGHVGAATTAPSQPDVNASVKQAVPEMVGSPAQAVPADAPAAKQGNE